MKPKVYQHVVNAAGAAYLAAKLLREHGQNPNFVQPAVTQLLVVVSQQRLAEELSANLDFFLAQKNSKEVSSFETSLHAAPNFEVLPFFGWDILPFDTLSPTQETSASRLYTLDQLLKKKPCLIVATVEALMQRVLPPVVLQRGVLSVVPRATLNRERLLSVLDAGGYIRSSIVEECGQIAVRGAVIDLFPPGSRYPLRLELFDDTVESLRTFDPTTQRSLMSLSSFDILPVRELPLFSAPGRDFSDDHFKLLSTNGVSPASLKKSFEAVMLQLRARASELEIPGQHIGALGEAILNNAPWPGIEHLLPFFCDRLCTLWDYIGETAQVLVCDQSEVTLSAHSFEEKVTSRALSAQREGRLFPEPSSAYIFANEFLEQLDRRTQVFFSGLQPFSSDFLLDKKTISDSPEERHVEKDNSNNRCPEEGLDDELSIASNEDLLVSLKKSRSRELPLQALADEIRRRFRQGLHLAFVVSHHARIRKFVELLSTYEIACVEFNGTFSEWFEKTKTSSAKNGTGVVSLLVGTCTAGITVAQERFSLVIDHEIFPTLSPLSKRSVSVRSVGRVIGSISQLQENDYVVHMDHGIGIYRGLKAIAIEDKVGDFLALEYAESARLFVPVENIGKVQKYSGAEGKKPALHRLGGKSWEQTKKKVHEGVAELAGQLLNLYAARKIKPGFSFGEVDSEDSRFADTFSFEETPDQERAIIDVLTDMGKERPMDRLICGDVGYGKTEVALRAAFKAVNRNKQVAMLVPTTILADQHYATFRERFAEFPVVIKCLSRFSSAGENKKTLQNLSAGNVDIVIGTHRLLQKDVFFKDLGLLVIDEEHRFGVGHKEKLKQLRREVDVLTLSATPIPRTLHMSLFGIRDLSTIETPPCDRQVVKTYIGTFETSFVREAILREIGRTGQVFYIHNRVSNISAVADDVAQLVPEARVAFAHGQMKETELEVIIHRFVNREIDVLVSTTIVESGLDIPNANTIIIREADKFGLAELYQLRGRVGRSSRRAWAYLLISDPRTLGPDAKKRLQVLQSLDDLGMGFRLALQDMEIRGAGNLLGKDQSGQVQLVGYELYSRILKDAVRELKLKAKEETQTERRFEVDPEMHIGFPAHIPTHYIPDVSERLILYQRLVELKDEREGRQIAEEIEDRFGRMPEEVSTLIEAMIFRSLLRQTGIISATFRNNFLSFAFHPEASFDATRVMAAVKSSAGRLKLRPDMGLVADVGEVEVRSPEQLTRFLAGVLVELEVRV